MDPISLAASLAALIQLSTKAARYLKEIKDGPEDRIKLREEIRGITCLLEMLQDRVDEADSMGKDLASIFSLKLPGGPMDQLTNALGQLVSSLTPKGRVQRLSRAILWPLSNKEAGELIQIIDRQKAALTLAIQNDTIGLSLAIKASMEDVTEKVTAMEIRQEDSRIKSANAEDQEILAWLSPLTFWARQQDVFDTRTDDTGIWLLESSEYRTWRSGSEKILWCHGMPGAGKTVLASVIVDDLQRHPPARASAVAFVYCNYKERSQQTFKDLVSSLTRQITNQAHTVPDTLRALHQRHIKYSTRPTRSELLELFANVASQFSSVWIVVDALDESNENDGTRSGLKSDLCTAVPNASFLFTSRRLEAIETQFRDLPSLEIRANDRDIRLYLSTQLENEARLAKHIKEDESLQRLILDTIVRRSDGMFLLARLHLGSLATKHTRKSIRSALQILPQQLDSTYEETMQRICDQTKEDASLAENVLIWVSHASRPLRMAELQHAIAAMDLDVGAQIDKEDLPEVDVLISVCAGIVVVDKESNAVRLVHYTAQEFFEKHPVLDPTVALQRITNACITYLSLEIFGTGPCAGNQALWQRFEEYPLLRYAAQEWGNHARGRAEKPCKAIILQFLQIERLRASALQASSVRLDANTVEDIKTWVRWSDEYRIEVPELAAAGAFGLTRIINHMLQEGQEVNAYDDSGATVLSWAAEAGQVDTVKALIAAGADVNISDVSRSSPLIEAAREGHHDVVKILLDQGADIGQRRVGGHTALYHAAWNGHQATLKLLLDEGADIMSEPNILDAAICSDSLPMIDLVISSIDAIKNSEAIESSLITSLHRIGPPSVAKIERLIKRGANPAYHTKKWGTPMHLAALKERVDIVKLFLKFGVDANLRSDDGYTPLHWATFKGTLEVAAVLKDAGADITARTDAGETALHTCLYYTSNDEMVQFILRGGVPLDVVDSRGRSALHGAAGSGFSSIVKILIENGAKIDIEDDKGWTPLHHAAASGQKDIVDYILKHASRDEQLSHQPIFRGAQLRIAIASQDDNLTQQLLKDPDISVDVCDHVGRTALHHAAHHGSKEVVTALLERNASVSATIADSAYDHWVNYLGHVPAEAYRCQWITPLHHAAGRGHVEIVAMLLDHGADVHAVGSEAYTPLNVAVSAGHIAVVKLLLDRGADIKHRGSSGVPLLYWATMKNNVELLGLLLEESDDEERGDKNVKQAYVLAVAMKFTGVVELMRSYGYGKDDR